MHPSVWQLIKEKNIPVLGICYGMQEIAHVFGGEVLPSKEREFGRAMVRRTSDSISAAAASDLLEGVDSSTGVQMWMSHGDKVVRLPENFLKVANTDNSEYAVIACAEKRMFGLQFHPEVTHSLGGHLILKNFVVGICGAPTDWNMHDIAEEFIKEVREVMIVVNICIIFYFLMSIFATF